MNFNIFNKNRKKLKELEMRINQLENKTYDLADKFYILSCRIGNLEEGATETDNILYELMNNLDAVDNRIDILGSTLEKQK